MGFSIGTKVAWKSSIMGKVRSGVVVAIVPSNHTAPESLQVEGVPCHLAVGSPRGHQSYIVAVPQLCNGVSTPKLYQPRVSWLHECLPKEKSEAMLARQVDSLCDLIREMAFAEKNGFKLMDLDDNLSLKKRILAALKIGPRSPSDMHLISALHDVRAALGVGENPMLSELAVVAKNIVGKLESIRLCLSHGEEWTGDIALLAAKRMMELLDYKEDCDMATRTISKIAAAVGLERFLDHATRTNSFDLPAAIRELVSQVEETQKLKECLRGFVLNVQHLNDPHFSGVQERLVAMAEKALGLRKGEEDASTADCLGGLTGEQVGAVGRG